MKQIFILILELFIVYAIISKIYSPFPDAISCANSHFALLYIRAVDASVWYCQIWTENRCVTFKATDGTYSGSTGDPPTIEACIYKSLSQLTNENRTFEIENSEIKRTIQVLQEQISFLKNDFSSLKNDMVSSNLSNNITLLTTNLKLANQQALELEKQLIYLKGSFDNMENGYSKANLIFGIISCVFAGMAIIISIAGCCLKMKESERAQLYLQKVESSSTNK